MQIRFVLGPAGSGKTYRCLSEIRDELVGAPDGPPLLFLAPKQATFQLERQLLADPVISGFTRLHIVSFERLARLLLDTAGVPVPALLGEEGRVMVLRSLLARIGQRLQVFHASSRMPSFSRDLSDSLRALQRNHGDPDRLLKLAGTPGLPRTLAAKLRDLALIAGEYGAWLDARALQDADSLPELALEAVKNLKPGPNARCFSRVWLDGFAEMTPQERALLSSIVSRCREATLAFCLEEMPASKPSWLSAWGVIGETFKQCHAELAQLPGAEITTEILERNGASSRFASSPELRHLEANWVRPRPMAWSGVDELGNPTFDFRGTSGDPAAVRLVECPHPDGEAGVAADGILKFVRQGGRFREVAVLARSLEQVPATFCRVFRRLGIPFFLDQRRPTGHHPLTELTRAVLRLVAFGWRHADWFGALKTGLSGLSDTDADRLENQALKLGIEGARWRQPVPIPAWFEDHRQRVVRPFVELEARLGNAPTGPALAAALRRCWEQLKVEDQLARWDREAAESGEAPAHVAVLESLLLCLQNVELAFPDSALPLVEWLSILESALGGLTVGLVPPALDQVLIGAIDRSRNPDLELVVLPGWNERLFPLVTDGGSILSRNDGELLESHGLSLATNSRARLGHERFYAYLALTRARRQVIVTYARADARGETLNPSPFVGRVRRLFPERAPEERPGTGPAAELPADAPEIPASGIFGKESLSAPVAACLHGPALETSVTAMEQFAECPFRFFAETALRAEERRLLEFEAREQGTLQHKLLARFHERLRAEGRNWRELTPEEARARLEAIADAGAAEFLHGVVVRGSGDHEFRFSGIKRSLGDFVAATVAWMAGNQFDPTFVEFQFGGDEGRLPAWRLDLGRGRTLALRGKIDRLDLWCDPESRQTWVLIVDYKSRARTWNHALTERGATIQLPAYLAALREFKLPRTEGPVACGPAGMVFAPLRGSRTRRETRPGEPGSELTAAPLFQHRGVLNRLLRDPLQQKPDGTETGQFKPGRPLKSGGWSLGDSVTPAELDELLDQVRELLRRHADRILDGEVAARPLRLGTHDACEHCSTKAICRISAVEL